MIIPQVSQTIQAVLRQRLLRPGWVWRERKAAAAPLPYVCRLPIKFEGQLALYAEAEDAITRSPQTALIHLERRFNRATQDLPARVEKRGKRRLLLPAENPEVHDVVEQA